MATSGDLNWPPVDTFSWPRTDGREPDVSSAGTVASIDFQVVQERAYERGVDIFKSE